MAERQEDSVAGGKEAKKKKAKRNVGSSTRSKEPSGMGSSNRMSSSRQGRDSTAADGGDDQRRRSRSADKKARRDSGTRRGSGISGKGMSGSSGRHQTGSPLRVRKTKSEGIEHNKPTSKGERTGAVRERSRSRSPTREKAGGVSPPRLPQRTVSESSNLQSNLQALNNRNKGNKESKTADNLEEASLGDYQNYSSQDKQQRSPLKMGEIPEESLGSFMAFHQQYEQEALLGLHDDDEIEAPYGPDKKPPKQQLKQQQQTQNEQSASLGALMNPMNKYGGLGGKAAANVPVEASMGSFTAFTKKSPNPQIQNEQSASLGALMNPMSQYGGGRGGKAPNAVDESLGSFTAFNKKYETDKLLGLDGSTMSALESASPFTKETGPPIVEESMGDFVHVASKEAEAEHHSKSRTKKGDRDAEEKEKEFGAVCLPTSRIKKLGKRGGVGYTIMVDSPGGHFQQPMKIVVAIEFDDDTDSDEGDEESVDDENDNPVEHAEDDDEPQWLGGQPKESFEQANEIDDSGHLPITPLEDDIDPNHHNKVPVRRKKHPGRLSGNAADGKPAGVQDDADEHRSDEEDDEVAPLASNIINSRWNHRTTSGGGYTLRQPEREKSAHSSSSHSTISSVTLESMLGGGGLSIEADNCASNANVLQRRPVGRSRPSITSASLKRPSGAVRAGGTASLLAQSLAPHNLGTRRGLMLRQQSEASMKSTGTSKSNDSSWTGNNNDLPEDYQASFMQLNLLDLDKTQIQTNEEVQKTELPEELLSGVEGISRSGSKEEGETPDAEDPETIAEGKDPQIAATELLGMKTMLKHIKRVAPKRSKSFEFDRDMPKQMWNKMFNKSQKVALPGSQYVDHDDSTSGNDEEGEDEKMQSTRVEESEQQKAVSSPDDKGETGDAPTTRVTGGLFSTIKRVASSAPGASSNPTEKSGTKAKSSFFSSAMKRVIPSAAKGTAPEETDQEQADEKDDEKDDEKEDEKDAAADASEGSLELDGILQELDRSLLSIEYEPDEPGAPSTNRRKPAERHNERPGRGQRVGHGPPKKGGTARSRAARAQHVHNRSLRDTLDFMAAEQGDEDLPQLDAIKEEKPRPRARRKPPVRTKSSDDNGPRGPPARTKSSDGTKGVLGRTRSHDGSSPIRPTREATKKMHQSFSGVDPGDLPGKVKTTRETPARTKSKDGGVGVHQHKDNPSRTSRADKGARAAGRKQRPVRKKSVTTESLEEPEPVINLGLKIPEDATENEVRELLDYH